jgi:glucose-1-phosphate thymidylyltransferase
MKAVILAAGYAVRLHPLTLDKPKCLLEVRGKFILDWLCEKICGLEDCDEIVIVTNAKFFPQFERWRESARSRLPIKILNDGTVSNETRLGAVGDLDFALKKIGLGADILVFASDNLFDSDLTDFAEFCGAKREVCVGLYDLGDKALAANKFGVLELDASLKVVGMEEKPASPKSALIGMGIYYFPAKSLSFVAEYLGGKDAKDAPGFYVRWLLGRATIYGFTFSGMWYDIGDLEALEAANLHFRPASVSDEG